MRRRSAIRCGGNGSRGMRVTPKTNAQTNWPAQDAYSKLATIMYVKLSLWLSPSLPNSLPSTGIPYVIVNGTVVVKNSKVLKDVYPGQPIRNAVLD